MNDHDDELGPLIDALIDDRCDDEGLRRLAALVRDDPRAREAYLDQMDAHALLEWRHGRFDLPADTTTRAPAPWRRRSRARWGLVAALVVGSALTILALRPGSGEVATVIEVEDVVWSEGQAPIAVGDRLSPQTIGCRSGDLRLSFDSGTEVVVQGPAQLDILSAMKLRAWKGRITARMTGELKGFTVETPGTVVVDQGTEFGVEVDSESRTGVVVFEGRVDVARLQPAKGVGPVATLEQGEGLRIGPAGELDRILTVRKGPGAGWSTGPATEDDAVIRSVRDNIRGLDSSKYYQVVQRGFGEDAPAYVDRPHQWNGVDAGGLPEYLQGADYIMPFNDDKWSTTLKMIVEVSRPVTLYVLLDDREKPPPWLAERFVDTGDDVGLDEGSWPDTARFSVEAGPGVSINQVFSVWARELDRGGSIELGSLAGGKNNRAMYGVAAVAKP